MVDHATWMLVLVLLGYPLLGTLVAFTSLPSLVASVPVRALVLLLSAALVYRSTRSVWAVPGYRVVLFFWLLYFVRLLWDLFVAGIPVAGEFMFTFVAFCVIPSLALMHAPRVNEHTLCWRLFLLGLVACMLAVLAGYTELAGGRSWTSETEGRLFLDTVNPITYGHVGVTTLLAALCVSGQCKRRAQWLLVAAAVVLGAMTIQLSGSRGPVISLLLSVIMLTLGNRRYRWLLLLPVGVGIWLFVGASAESDNLIASRLVASAQSDNSEIRVVMQAGAIQQFLDSPFVGSAIIERQFEDFPHNPVIESAMALGVPGLSAFVVISIATIAGIWRLFRAGALMLPLVAMQYFCAAQFSGSIAESASLWVAVALVIGSGTRARMRVRRRRSSATLRRSPADPALR